MTFLNEIWQDKAAQFSEADLTKTMSNDHDKEAQFSEANLKRTMSNEPDKEFQLSGAGLMNEIFRL